MSYRSDVAALEARRASLRQELEALREPVRAEAAARAALRNVEEALATRRALVPRLRAPQVRVACDEPWSAMRGSDTQRRCDRCKKDVFKLDAMSDAEVAAFVAAPGEACARFYVRADETIVTEDCNRKGDRSGLAVLAGSILVSGALVAGAFVPTSKHEVRTVTVEQVVAGEAGKHVVTSCTVRVRARIVPGSLTIGDRGATFALEGEGPSPVILHVYHAGILPDGAAEMARLGEPVTVQGSVGADGLFAAEAMSVPRLRQGYLVKGDRP